MSEIVRYSMPFYDDGVEFVKAADLMTTFAPNWRLWSGNGITGVRL